jgi:O-antigen biosynthesis protein
VAHATQAAWEPLNSRHNFTVIHNGLDPQRLHAAAAAHDRKAGRAALGIGDDELGIVLLGTVCDRKGQLDLVRALASLPRDLLSRLRIFIVGDRVNRYSDRLHAEAEALPMRLRERLAIIPESGDPYRYLVAADIAVCSSRIESYPRVTLEAMGFGLPLVSTPVFGIAEQVREGVNGLFYQPGDVAQLARHLARLAGDDALRVRLGRNGVQMLASLPGYEDMLDGYGRIFQEARLSRGAAFETPSLIARWPRPMQCAG